MGIQRIHGMPIFNFFVKFWNPSSRLIAKHAKDFPLRVWKQGLTFEHPFGIFRRLNPFFVWKIKAFSDFMYLDT